MKSFFSFFICALFFVLNSAQAQWTGTVYAGAAPGQDVKSKAVSLPDWYEGSDFALEPMRQSVTYAIGVSAKRTYESGFFLRSDLMYNTSQTDYRLYKIGEDAESNPANTFSVREHRLTVPLSIGADLGNFSAHSGVDVTAIVASDDELERLPGIEDNSSSVYLGWHAGLGYTLGRVGLEVRYMQDFRNYGGRLVYGSKDITYYGNRSRIMFLASFAF